MSERKRGGPGRGRKPGAEGLKRNAAETAKRVSAAARKLVADLSPASEPDPAPKPAPAPVATPDTTEDPVLVSEPQPSPMQDAPAPFAADAGAAPVRDDLESTTALPPTAGTGHLVVSYAQAVEQAPPSAADLSVPSPADLAPAPEPVEAVQETAATASDAVETASDAVQNTAELAQNAVQDNAEAVAQAARDTGAAAAELAQSGLARAESAAESVSPLVEAAVAPVAALAETGAQQAREGLSAMGGADAFGLGSDALVTGEALRRAVTESAAAAARGLFEINGKLVEIMRASNEAQVRLWQSALAAGSMPEAVQIQAEEMRRTYQATAEQWRDLAHTTTRVMGETLHPLQALQPNLGAWTGKTR